MKPRPEHMPTCGELAWDGQVGWLTLSLGPRRWLTFFPVGLSLSRLQFEPVAVGSDCLSWRPGE